MGDKRGTPDVIGELVREVRETFIKPLDPGIRDLLMVPGKSSKPLDEEEEPPQAPPPLRQPKPQADLKFDVSVTPSVLVAVGTNVTVLAKVEYRDVGANGRVSWWPYPDKWVSMQFQGKDHDGAGPFTFEVKDIGALTIKLRAIVGNGKTVTLKTATITSVCTATLPADQDLKELVCILFSEGGSSKKFGDEELVAVAWTLRNRRDALLEAQKTKNTKHWDYFASRWARGPNGSAPSIETPVTFSRMIHAPKQFTGVNGEEWNKCVDPAKNVATRFECDRVKKCVEIIEGVVLKGQPPDPYAGKGNADKPGVFYYKLHGNTPPHKGPKLPPLTAKDNHFYQGLDPDFVP